MIELGKLGNEGNLFLWRIRFIGEYGTYSDAESFQRFPRITKARDSQGVTSYNDK